MASFDYTFTSGDTVTPTKLNSARNVKDIVNADIKSDAAIALSKLATGALPAAITVASDNLVDGTIVNADINASAAIAGTKVAPNFGSQNILTTGSAGFGTTAIESGFRMHVTGSGFFSGSSGTTTKLVADTVDQRLVLGSYFESGVGQHAFIASTNNAETGNSALLFQTGTTERMRIDASGNVGINSASPTSKLTVVENSANDAVRITQTGSGNALVVEDSANPDATPFVVTADGSVGIGASSANAKLQFDNAVATNGYDANKIRLYDDGTTVYGLGIAPAQLGYRAEQHVFYSDATTPAERLRIGSSGNVGIGTAIPTERLEVNGTVKATAFSGPLTGNVTGNVTGNLTGTASAIADGSVSTAKIVDGNVTLAKLVTAVQQALVPAGAVQAFAMNSAPAGWLAADGSNVNRTTYAALFTAIGTTYGVGDGSTTFALPDLRGYFVRGSGTNSDGTAAGTFGTKQADDLKSHTHSGSFLLSSGPLNLGGTGASILAPLTVGSVTDTGGAETRPKNIAMLYCIKF